MAGTEGDPPIEDVLYMLNHVFLPPKLPQADDSKLERDIALCDFTYRASFDFQELLPGEQQQRWSFVVRMLEMLVDSTIRLDKATLRQDILNLDEGGAITLRIRAQNAALIIRRRKDVMTIESFEAQPLPEAVMQAEGKLLCSYPGPAVEVPLDVARDPSFVENLVSFLVQMDMDKLPKAQPVTIKAGSKVAESRSTAHPRYITQLLSMILLGMGKEAQVERITKRIADEVCWQNAKDPWRRSPLWLVIRVAIQTTAASREIYKLFMVFLQMKLLRLFLKNDLPSELLYVTRVKASRRVYKLGSAASPLLESMKALCEDIQERMQQRWSEAQRRQAQSPSYIPDPSDFEKHTVLSLTKSRSYLEEVMQRKSSSAAPVPFEPNHHERLRDIPNFDFSMLRNRPSIFTDAVEADPFLALFDFESLVEERLDDWVVTNKHDESAPETLHVCLKKYTEAAKTHYSSYPEDESIMILTVMELWVALDVIAIAQCPLLQEYSPEIPTSFLNSLLLRKSKSTDRAANIEIHLRKRHDNARAFPSIFSDVLSYDNFSLRYFQNSPHLQEIKSSIEENASKLRKEKLAELSRKNAEHAELEREMHRTSCHTDVYGRHRYWSCPWHRLQRMANDMDIDIYEWPLPHTVHEAEMVVFELNRPPVFGYWREWTYYVLRDVGSSGSGTHLRFEPNQLLHDYNPLNDPAFSSGSTAGCDRLTLASEKKSFLKAHYRTVKIPQSEDNVCVNNGLEFHMYDSHRREKVHSTFCVDLERQCTFRISSDAERPYHGLQYAIARTDHAHNATIVNQGDSSPSLTLHEHLAFSNLRCGSKLQWMNIARELHTNILAFSHEEVHLLMMQTAWQLGTLSADALVREWHYELERPEFGQTLIQECTNVLSNVNRNWMENITVKTIIYLISRLLASAQDPNIKEEAYLFLREARFVTCGWMRDIVRRLDNAVKDDQRQELQRQICSIAAICRATFDVDDEHLDALLHSQDDVGVLIESSIAVHGHMPPRIDDTSMDFQILLRRDRRLSYNLEGRLRRLALINIDTFKSGMDFAVHQVWSGYCAGSYGWKHLPDNNSRWLMSSTASLEGSRTQQIGYNLLDGTLLIDGRPIGRLTREIMGHDVYKRIFGQRILDVVPSPMPGMDYATRSPIHDYTLFFALHGSTLRIRAQLSNASKGILELIPHSVLKDDFPKSLTMEYAHWMDLETGVVEFRPLDRLWEDSDQRLRYSSAGPSKFEFVTSARCLIDKRSPSFIGITGYLRTLESVDYITITYRPGLDLMSGNIAIDLPRLRLSFFLNADSQIESTNMPNMIIDSDQCVGTMIGLRSQLVLRPKEDIYASLPRSRSVIIPFGKVRCSLEDSESQPHVDIDTLTTQFRRLVPWYKYDVDSDLGSLAGDVDLTARLYRIYLHAVCSHPLPDPLTHQRGTDYALKELRSSASLSFQSLSKVDIHILGLISRLTPRRQYYPIHLRTMQDTDWLCGLPALSQHDAFSKAVKNIKDYAASLNIFAPQTELDLRTDFTHFLSDRAEQRSSIYHEDHILLATATKYNTRDRPEYDSSGIDALKASQLVFAWPSAFNGDIESYNLADIFEKWSNISRPAITVSLKYTKNWLDLDLPSCWLSIYELCRQCGDSSRKFELVFSFAALAYDQPDFLRHIPLLVCLASNPESTFRHAPSHSNYKLGDGVEPRQTKVKEMIMSGTRDISETPCSSLAKYSYESEQSFSTRIREHYDRNIRENVNQLLQLLMEQCRSHDPPSPFSSISQSAQWFDAPRVMNDIREYFASCSHNWELLSFARELVKDLQAKYVNREASQNEVGCGFKFVPNLVDNPCHDSALGLTLQSLLERRPSVTREPVDYDFGLEEFNKSQETRALDKLIFQFRGTSSSYLTKAYTSRLEGSKGRLNESSRDLLPRELPPVSICLAYRSRCKNMLDSFWESILFALRPSSPQEDILFVSGLWPPIHPRAMLCCISARSGLKPSSEWIEALTNFAGLLLSYQYSQRLVLYALRSEVDNFYKELQNASFNADDARRYPEWLLVQIQGNFMTRAVQSEIAHEMLEPSSGGNTVLQLNMGEGKSHVIVPLISVALADTAKLVRVVVPKPLAAQMFHLLRERISGLTDRRVFYLPFSRDVKVDGDHLRRIRELFEECVRVQGVLVIQPEHILSFRLMVLDRLLSSNPLQNSNTQDLQKLQAWITSVSRDVLDESDELLHVRYQLIYTMGLQQPFDGSPDRWSITQDVLNYVRQAMEELYDLKSFSEEVEFIKGASGGEYPYIRLLDGMVSKEVVSRIATHVADKGINHLTLVGLGSASDLRKAVLSFLTERSTSEEDYELVRNRYGDSGQWKGLLLLRGLLAHGVLLYVLSQQRWRVDYGLDPGRSLLAVPYRAKDMPSVRSEFGHPDVAICLTCLSYYYGGLTIEQVQECFDLLLRLDNPGLEYEQWVGRGGESIPESLQLLIGVNMKDTETFKAEVVPVFQRNQATIDFFLSRVVFPREAVEFTSRLGTSGWDLAEKKNHVTTGFSGTNDNSDLLPTSIAPANNDKQQATNALVLGYMLRPENDRYVCVNLSSSSKAQPEALVDFLDYLVTEPKRGKREIRVLLDVGAQMLEMTNQQLIKRWLELTEPDVAAGVFFDEGDQLNVVGRDGVVELLHASPFFHRLQECIIYLDDAHTRGTDLKLPSYYRAAVTLGPKVTKDRLVQGRLLHSFKRNHTYQQTSGCMRMRKLGQGQSVMFCAPPEVDKRIRDTQKVPSSEEIKVIDMLSWVMSRTCEDIEEHVPHWIDQGLDYHKRKAADPTGVSSEEDVRRLEEAWLQPAARSLEDMYGKSQTDSDLLGAVGQIPEMRDRLQELGVTQVRDGRMEEEQEREVSHELEEQRQVERPEKIKPAQHRLDELLRCFVKRGIVPSTQTALFPLMTPLLAQLEKLSPGHPWLKGIFCTRDFMITTHDGRERSEFTSYLRSVQWILSHKRLDGSMLFVVLSPFEANELLPDIRTSQHVRLHMYAPRTNQAMKPMDDLTFYCIPPLSQGTPAWTPPSLDVRCQLNIWSGQLYLDSYTTYRRLCLLLGLSSSESLGYTEVNTDRFVPPSGRVGEMVQACLFDKSPVTMLKTLFGLRRKGMSYDMTHMGKVLSARLLIAKDFDESDGNMKEA